MNNKKDNIKSALFTVGITIMSIFLLLSLFVLIVFDNDDCYRTNAVLNEQRVGDLEGCCDNCLIFNVTEFVCKGQPDDGCGCEWKNRELYFANEQQKRNDLHNGSEIWINWCWIDNINDYRVRGVEMIQ